MKSQTLPIKRRPVNNGMFRRLSAKTQRRRKQKVSAAGTVGEMGHDDGGSRISWALTIVFLIHIVALCLIFIHHHFISGRPLEQSSLPESRVVAPAAAVVEESSPRIIDSQLSAGQTPYIVRSGDNYASVAKAHDVQEGDLREVNGNVDIRPGYILRIPVKRVVVKAPAQTLDQPVAAQPTKVEARPQREQGLVKAIDFENVPRAKLVAMQAASGTYVVQPNDSIWRIAKRFGIDQNRLMELNGIEDARKLRVGMKLKLPSNAN